MNLSIDYAHNAAFSHAWSLCVEEHFYLLFPLLAWVLMRKPASWRFVTLGVLLVLGGIVLRSAIWLHFTEADPDRNWFVEELYYPTWCRLDGLLAGVALAALQTFRPRAWARWQQHANVVLGAGLLVMALAIWLFRDRVGLLGNSVGWPVLALGLALLVFAGAERRSLIGRWRVPGAAWLAAVSYSLYLMHKQMYHLLESAYGPQLQDKGVLACAAYGLAALAGGALLHYAVERPFLRLRERWRRRDLRPSGLPQQA